jgi:hypothetical protein
VLRKCKNKPREKNTANSFMHNKEIMKKGSDTCEVQGILGKIV